MPWVGDHKERIRIALPPGASDFVLFTPPLALYIGTACAFGAPFSEQSWEAYVISEGTYAVRRPLWQPPGEWACLFWYRGGTTPHIAEHTPDGTMEGFAIFSVTREPCPPPSPLKADFPLALRATYFCHRFYPLFRVTAPELQGVAEPIYAFGPECQGWFQAYSLRARVIFAFAGLEEADFRAYMGPEGRDLDVADRVLWAGRLFEIIQVWDAAMMGKIVQLALRSVPQAMEVL